MAIKETSSDLQNTLNKCVGKRALFQVVLAIVVSAGIPSLGFAIPPDPQRSFEVSNCAAAKERLQETLIGSPLISKDENAETVIKAREWAEKLCGSDMVQKLISEFDANVNTKHD